MENPTKIQVRLVELILVAFKELYEIDKTKYYTIEEFYSLLNKRGLEQVEEEFNITFENIKDVIPKMTTVLSENYERTGKYQYFELGHINTAIITQLQNPVNIFNVWEIGNIITIASQFFNI